MSAVGPFKLTIAVDLGVVKISTVDEVFIRLHCPLYLVDCDCSIKRFAPLFVAFAHNLTIDEISPNLDLTLFKLLDTLTAHLILDPGASVL